VETGNKESRGGMCYQRELQAEFLIFHAVFPFDVRARGIRDGTAFIQGAKMRTIAEKQREIPVGGEYDVIVAGGGTAGAVAAIAASRHGAHTLVVEQFGFLGGTQTGGLVGPLCPNYHEDGTPLTRGIGQEIWNRLALRGGGEQAGNGRYLNKDWPWFDPEGLKYLLDDMVTEAGVDILFHAFVSDVLVEDGAVRGLIVESKSGRQALLARCVVDATGDADVAFRAGVPCESGRKSDGLNQPASLRFHLGNVDWTRAAEFLRENGMPWIKLPTVSYGAGGGAKDLEHVILKAVEDGLVDAEAVRYFQFFSLEGRPGEVSFNCPELRANDPADAREISRMQIEGRRQILQLMSFCRKCIPGFEQCYVVSTAPMVGVRSSRRIVGEYVLTERDVLGGTKFEDAVARNNWPIDIHSPKEGEGLVLKEEEAGLAPGDYVEVPYGSIVPKEIDSLLVAGRCISATFEAQAAIRISRTCQALGQAAGTAAALCAIGGEKPRALDGRILHEVLARDGMF
jgi:hypothetical protein